MMFGAVATSEAAGAILAHTLSLPAGTLKKGRVLLPADIAALLGAGVEFVTVARPDAAETAEDDAAAAIAAAVAGDGIVAAPAATGRANLYAALHGVVVIDAARIDRINAIDESVTVATVAAYAPVLPRGMIATVKIIPFAVPRVVLDACIAEAGRGCGPAIRLAPLRARRLGLVQTALPSLKPSVLAASVETTRARIVSLGSTLAMSATVAHDAAAVAEAIARQRDAGCAPILVLGASAIVDRRDVIPAAIQALGGEIVHFGMPVDPGNLLLMGRLGDAPVIGLPGCARSPKLNGADWVLQRLLADLPVGAAEITRMGVGGLLSEIPSRPVPRRVSQATPAAPLPRIAAVVLAAGQGTRMGADDKLLAPLAGRPLLDFALDAALASPARPVLVVLGHRPERLQPLLRHRDVQVVVNTDHAAGLASSLRAAVAALPASIDGAVFLLGDMPQVGAHHVERMIAAFADAEPGSICVPTHRGKRGNPVLWPAVLLPELATVEGDAGGRALFGRHAHRIVEVALDDAVLIDVDRPEDLQRLARAASPSIANDAG